MTLRTILVVLSIVMAGSAIVSPAIRVARGASSIPTTYDWTGYQGNNSIYMNRFISNSYTPSQEPQYLPIDAGTLPVTSTNLTSTIPYTETVNNNPLYNSMSFSMGGSNLTYDYQANIGMLLINLYFSTIGAFRVNTSDPPGYPTPPAPSITDAMKVVIPQQIGVSNFTVVPHVDTLTGFNLTTSGTQGINSTVASLILGLLSFVPVVGFAFGAASVALTLDSLVNGMPESSSPTMTTSSFSGAGTLYCEQSNPLNSVGYPTTGNYSGPYSLAYQNVYGMGQWVQIEVSQAGFDQTKQIYLNASNILTDSLGTYLGACKQVAIDLVPSYEVYGHVSLNGNDMTNTPVNIEQTVNGHPLIYQVHTNSKGYYRFFAMPSSPGLSPTLNISVPTVNAALGVPDFLNFTAGNSGGYRGFNVSAQTGELTGQVTNQNTGGAINGAGVTLSDSNGSVTAYTNGSGDYTIYFPVTAYYHIVASAGGYNSAGTYETMDTGSSYTVDLALTPQSSGGGGGGCVLYGTDIALANGSVIQAQYLRIGMKTLSYNVNTGEFENTTVSAIVVTNVTSVIEVDGFIGISGLTDQPIYVMLSNGTPEWTMLGQLNYSMKLFDPLNSSWIPVYNLTTLHGNFTVYDITTTPGFNSGGIMRFDYVANGILLDKKICGGCL